MSYTNETTGNTSEMPMNNQPTFEPNQYYYCVTDTYKHNGVEKRKVYILKVDKQSRSGKSVWLKNNSNYCIIKMMKRVSIFNFAMKISMLLIMFTIIINLLQILKMFVVK